MRFFQQDVQQDADQSNENIAHFLQSLHTFFRKLEKCYFFQVVNQEENMAIFSKKGKNHSDKLRANDHL